MHAADAERLDDYAPVAHLAKLVKDRRGKSWRELNQKNVRADLIAQFRHAAQRRQHIPVNFEPRCGLCRSIAHIDALKRVKALGAHFYGAAARA